MGNWAAVVIHSSYDIPNNLFTRFNRPSSHFISPFIPLFVISKISLFHSLGFPILLGMSRKKFIKDVSGKNDSKHRLGGTIGSTLFALMQGVQVLRVHEVNEIIQGIKIFKKLLNN